MTQTLEQPESETIEAPPVEPTETDAGSGPASVAGMEWTSEDHEEGGKDHAYGNNTAGIVTGNVPLAWYVDLDEYGRDFFVTADEGLGDLPAAPFPTMDAAKAWCEARNAELAKANTPAAEPPAAEPATEPAAPTGLKPDGEEASVQIPVRMLQVVGVAAKENGRYAIDGVLIEAEPDAGVVVTVATDGRRLIVAEWETEQGQLFDAATRIIVSGNVARTAIKLGECGHGDEEAMATVRRTKSGCQITVTTADGDAVLTWMENDGAFPLYRTIIPDWSLSAGISTIGIAPDVLIGALKALEKVLEDGSAVRVHLPEKADRPLGVESIGGGQVKALAVVMPVNIHDWADKPQVIKGEGAADATMAMPFPERTPLEWHQVDGGWEAASSVCATGDDDPFHYRVYPVEGGRGFDVVESSGELVPADSVAAKVTFSNADLAKAWCQANEKTLVENASAPAEPAPAPDDSWRSEPLTTIPGLSEKDLAKLAAAGITDCGKLEDWRAAGYEPAINGFGEGSQRRQKVDDAQVDRLIRLQAAGKGAPGPATAGSTVAPDVADAANGRESPAGVPAGEAVAS